MAFEKFFERLTQPADKDDYQGIFGTTASELSLSSDLSSLSADAEGIVTWVRYRLGEPKITCELDNRQIFSSFEEANIRYSAIINQSEAKKWLSNFLGLSKDSDFTNKLPHQTLDHLKRLSRPYGAEAQVGGLITPRKAYLNAQSDKSEYRILQDFIDKETAESLDSYVESQHSARPEIRKVYYQEPSYMFPYHDAYSNMKMIQSEFHFNSFQRGRMIEVQPVWADILSAGIMEVSRRVRGNNYSYHIQGDMIRLLPAPTEGKVWIEYTLEMDPFNPDFASSSSGDPSVNGISSMFNIPYRDIKYYEMNSTGKHWVRQMTLAISMEILGRIRSKYSSIPVPNSEISLDGESLISQAIEMQDKLTESLKEEISETDNLAMMRSDADLAAAIEEQYQRIPFTSPILILG